MKDEPDSCSCALEAVSVAAAKRPPVNEALPLPSSRNEPLMSCKASLRIATEIFGPFRVQLRDRAHVEPDVQNLAVDARDDRMLAERQNRRIAILHHDYVVDLVEIAEEAITPLQPPAAAGLGEVQEHFLELGGELRVCVEIVVRPRRPEAGRIDRLAGAQPLCRSVAADHFA